MKRYSLICLLAVLLMPLALVSCSEDDNTVEEFPNWMEANTDSISRLYDEAGQYADGSWKIIRNYSLEGTIASNYTNSIVVKVLKEGTGSGYPMFSDSVKVNYRGRLMASTSYPEGYVFDQSYEGDYNFATALPAKLYVGGMIDGVATALMNMRIGDRWEIYIPYQLGYGATGSSSIPAYSTLVFDMELVAYYRAGVSPKSRAVGEGVWITE